MRRSERRPNRVYTAVVVGSSPAGPTHITAAQSSGFCHVLRLSSTQSAAASNARATDRACTGVRNS